MAARKSREQEELEARMRAVRAYERRMEDIAWKFETFLPTLEKFQQGLLKKKQSELESGE